MIEDMCPVCGLPKELCVCSNIEKENSVIEIRTEKRKYGKLWAVISGFDNSIDLKSLLKKIKNKLACGGTVKGKSIEILYGRNDRTKEVIEILSSMGFDEDSIHISKQ